jgi:ArsR family transcriptional regulator, arsenate/arsenite/antimonite-responsive transcriptional repressor / arsenate reductase (thioredoxin)
MYQAKLMYHGGVAEMAQQFLRVVADPHRWRLMTELAHSDRRVGELTHLVGDAQNLVSYHLRELRDAGLVSSRRSSFDGRDTYYRLELTRCCELLNTVGVALNPGLETRVRTPCVQVRRQRTLKVLFMCTGNSARSQMAEILLEHLSDHTIEARSAGSHPKPLHPNAIKVMAARGLDISGRTSKHLRRFARTRFDQVITLCDKVREICPEFPGSPATAHWSMADPAAAGTTDEETYPVFERTAADLEHRIGFLIARLSTTEGGSANVG